MSLKILLADDSMTAQNMGKKILADGGYEVVTVSNGAAAVKKLAEFTPDLVIADVYMPGYNGLEICDRIKKNQATAAMPVLLSVGKLEPFRPEEGLKVHADGIIIKPFEATDLLAVTAKLAERIGKPAATAPVEAAQAAPAETSLTQEPEPEATMAVESTVPEANVEVPAFGLEEVAAAPAFSLDEHQPDYVREYGLDPHDAPTTMFPTPFTRARAADESSFVAHVPDLEAEAADLPVDAQADVTPAPAAANAAINTFTLPAPDAPAAAASGANDDDFDAKLAQAMAAYEEPTRVAAVPHTDDELPPASAPIAMPAPPLSGVMPVSPAWVTEEAPLSQSEQAVNLEDELRAYAAATAVGVSSVRTVAPSGPIGDTSVDDEVSAVVEQSKEHFFQPTLADRVHAMLDDAGMPPAVEEVEHPELQAAIEPGELHVPAVGDEVLAEPAATAAVPEPTTEMQFAEDPAAEPLVATEGDLAAFDDQADAAEVPELLTHDVPTEWASTPVADSFSEPEPEAAPDTIVMSHGVLSHDDFVGQEAPFAHAAVDEVAAEAAVPAPVVAAVDHAREQLVEEIHSVVPALHEADIANAVERVMERMKNTLVTEIARELAAKMK